MKQPFIYLSLLLGITACSTVGPSYQAPSNSPPAQWKNANLLAEASASSPLALANWWKTLNDPTLNTLIDTALAQNYDLQTAQAKLRESRARAGVADAALYPALNTSTKAGRTHSAKTGNTTESYSAGLDASWELDIFGANRQSQAAAEASAQASEATLQDTQVSLIAEVAQLYINLRTLESRRALTLDSLNSQQETRDLVNWRWQAGLVSELEAKQADSALAQTRAKIPALDNQIEQNRNQLAVLLGQTPAQLADLAVNKASIPDFAAISGGNVPLDALLRRPDIRAAERKLAAQHALVNAATAARYPKLSLSASLSLQSNNLSQLLRADSLINNLAANLSAPLFDAGRITQNIAIQESVLQQSYASYQKTYLQALADVENALMFIATSQDRRTALNEANQAATLAESLARQRYASGLTDYLTVLDTQRTLLSVQDALRSADGDHANALVQLYKALGGGWQLASTHTDTKE